MTTRRASLASRASELPADGERIGWFVPTALGGAAGMVVLITSAILLSMTYTAFVEVGRAAFYGEAALRRTCLQGRLLALVEGMAAQTSSYS